MEKKLCTRCKKTLPIREFSKKTLSKDGYSCWCRECYSKYHKEYCGKYPDRIKAQREKWSHSDKPKKSWRKYDALHREQRRLKEHKWRAKNKDWLCKKELYRLHNDPIYFMKARCRKIIRESFSRKNLNKPNHTEEIVGCSLANLREFLLETWRKNYGTDWNGEPFHIDHITPLSTVDTREGVLTLCHYTNLQMLKPEDNLRKGKNEKVPDRKKK